MICLITCQYSPYLDQIKQQCDMSDHLPILTLLRQTKLNNNAPLIFESRNLNDKNIKLINDALQKIDWCINCPNQIVMKITISLQHY